MRLWVLGILLTRLVFVGCAPDDALTEDAIDADSDVYFALIDGQDTVEINTEWEDAGADWRVNDSVEIQYTEDDVAVDVLGLHTVTYTVVHEGETHEIIRYVMVVDQTPPVITLNPGIDTVVVGETWVDAGANVTDNSGETLTITVRESVNTTQPGTYEVVYEATDASGNTATVIRYVNVVK